MNTSDCATQNTSLVSWFWIDEPKALTNAVTPSSPPSAKSPKIVFAPLMLVRQWLDNVEIRNAQLAHWLCKLIPTQCPFERDVKLLGRTVLHIPPLCKLNPVYDEVVGLRFRALCYLADECGEDVTLYC